MINIDDVETYEILNQSSDLPVFRTNLTIEKYKKIENKVYIPITDKDATLSFYMIYHTTHNPIYNDMISNLEHIDWSLYESVNE